MTLLVILVTIFRKTFEFSVELNYIKTKINFEFLDFILFNILSANNAIKRRF